MQQSRCLHQKIYLSIYWSVYLSIYLFAFLFKFCSFKGVASLLIKCVDLFKCPCNYLFTGVYKVATNFISLLPSPSLPILFSFTSLSLFPFTSFERESSYICTYKWILYNWACICIFSVIVTNMYTCKRPGELFMHICMYIYVHIYIYIYT